MEYSLRPTERGEDSESTDGTAVVSTFEATITDGTLAIDTADPADDSLELIEEDKTGRLSGEILADGTWQTTAATWPAVEPEVDLPPMFEFDIDISSEGPLRGTFDPETGTMTADLALRVDIHVSAVVKSMDVTMEVDAAELTTGDSGAMSGAGSGLDTGSASVTLVDNTFTVPETGTDPIDDKFGLPATDPDQNWLELVVEFDIATPVERV
jgi:hypothetical protein